MKIFLSLCVLSICISRKYAVAKVNYQISVLNEKVFEICKQYPNNFLDKKFDLSNITFTYVEDDKLLATGSMKYIGNALKKDAKISAELQVFKKQRGEWVSTVYNFFKPDLCKSVWNPTELWYSLTKNVPEEMKICPPQIGTVYELDFEADLLISNSSDRNAGGDYNFQIILKFGPMPDDLVCFEVLTFLEKL